VDPLTPLPCVVQTILTDELVLSCTIGRDDALGLVYTTTGAPSIDDTEYCPLALTVGAIGRPELVHGPATGPTEPVDMSASDT
jgi:hypothetical protein